ncbi:MAG: UbiA family prenyltransferase [Candidatus Heimdallarchaeota archaeon]|nr:MAG: UbiA family prenyltransferase [Candidatus Heimdallarchaeota archaeon]
MKEHLQIIRELFILSRPEWGFIFAGVAYMLSLFYLLPLISLSVAWLSIYAFACGHFSLNGFFDKDSDSLNPRRFSLRNPLVSSNLLSPRMIYLWVGILWLSVIPLNIFFIPEALTFPKLPLAFGAYFLAVVGSFIYSVPPLRFKAKPFIDLIVTTLIIGVFIPFYIGLLGFDTIVNTKLLFYGIILCVLLVFGIHLPTILTDLEVDQKNGEMTTAVLLGWEKASYFTSTIICVRVVGLAIVNLILMNEGILIPNFIPFLLGVIELVLAGNLVKRKNRDAALLLWKVVILTSITGGIIFGLLYTPK